MAEEGEPLEIVEFDQSLDEVEQPPELPNGIYGGEIQDIQVAVSAGKGNKYYAMTVHIPQEEIPANMQEFFEDGATLTYNRQLVPKQGDRRTLFRLRKLLEALDVETQGVTSFDPNDLMGMACRVQIKQRLYEGEMRAGIQNFVAVTAEAPARGKANSRRTTAEPVEEADEEEAPVVAPRRGAKPTAKPTTVGRRR